MTPLEHTPAMVAEVLELLEPRARGLYIDATVGLGGHADAILARSAPDGRLVAMDQDPAALEQARHRLAVHDDRVIWRHGNFADLPSILNDLNLGDADGILMDLGISSLQLAQTGRGFSFLRDDPLDMRMNPETQTTAADVCNRWRGDVLERILKDYGEERWARRIATAIVSRRRREPFRTTLDLAQVVERCVPRGKSGSARRIHPATRTFQALRIAVNDELDRLSIGLEGALTLLGTGGVLCVIAFHSLEDRIVKRRFRAAAFAGDDARASDSGTRFELLTRRPLRPTDAEVHANVRSRSARLRAIRRRS